MERRQSHNREISSSQSNQERRERIQFWNGEERIPQINETRKNDAIRNKFDAIRNRVKEKDYQSRPQLVNSAIDECNNYLDSIHQSILDNPSNLTEALKNQITPLFNQIISLSQDAIKDYGEFRRGHSPRRQTAFENLQGVKDDLQRIASDSEFAKCNGYIVSIHQILDNNPLSHSAEVLKRNITDILNKIDYFNQQGGRDAYENLQRVRTDLQKIDSVLKDGQWKSLDKSLTSLEDTITSMHEDLTKHRERGYLSESELEEFEQKIEITRKPIERSLSDYFKGNLTAEEQIRSPLESLNAMHKRWKGIKQQLTVFRKDQASMSDKVGQYLAEGRLSRAQYDQIKEELTRMEKEIKTSFPDLLKGEMEVREIDLLSLEVHNMHRGLIDIIPQWEKLGPMVTSMYEELKEYPRYLPESKLQEIKQENENLSTRAEEHFLDLLKGDQEAKKLFDNTLRDLAAKHQRLQEIKPRWAKIKKNMNRLYLKADNYLSLRSLSEAQHSQIKEELAKIEREITNHFPDSLKGEQGARQEISRLYYDIKTTHSNLGNIDPEWANLDSMAISMYQDLEAYHDEGYSSGNIGQEIEELSTKAKEHFLNFLKGNSGEGQNLNNLYKDIKEKSERLKDIKQQWKQFKENQDSMSGEVDQYLRDGFLSNTQHSQIVEELRKITEGIKNHFPGLLEGKQEAEQEISQRYHDLQTMCSSLENIDLKWANLDPMVTSMHQDLKAYHDESYLSGNIGQEIEELSTKAKDHFLNFLKGDSGERLNLNNLYERVKEKSERWQDIKQQWKEFNEKLDWMHKEVDRYLNDGFIASEEQHSQIEGELVKIRREITDHFPGLLEGDREAEQKIDQLFGNLEDMHSRFTKITDINAKLTSMEEDLKEYHEQGYVLGNGHREIKQKIENLSTNAKEHFLNSLERGDSEAGQNLNNLYEDLKGEYQKWEIIKKQWGQFEKERSSMYQVAQNYLYKRFLTKDDFNQIGQELTKITQEISKEFSNLLKGDQKAGREINQRYDDMHSRSTKINDVVSKLDSILRPNTRELPQIDHDLRQLSQLQLKDEIVKQFKSLDQDLVRHLPGLLSWSGNRFDRASSELDKINTNATKMRNLMDGLIKLNSILNETKTYYMQKISEGFSIDFNNDIKRINSNIEGGVKELLKDDNNIDGIAVKEFLDEQGKHLNKMKRNIYEQHFEYLSRRLINCEQFNNSLQQNPAIELQQRKQASDSAYARAASTKSKFDGEVQQKDILELKDRLEELDTEIRRFENMFG